MTHFSPEGLRLPRLNLRRAIADCPCAAYYGLMDQPTGFRTLRVRRVLQGMLFMGALGLAALTAVDAHADMCLNGGNPDRDAPNPDAGDGSVSMNRKRNLGAGLLASASIATVWLSLRRPGGKKQA